MYEELEKYLLGYLPANYWYDEGVDIAQDILSNFENEDWKKLLQQLSDQDTEWKKKLAYCLYNDGNKYKLLILLELVDTKDEELLEITLDSLRTFINKETAIFFLNHPEIIRRIKELYCNSGKPTQIILVDLFNKINEFTQDKLIMIDS